MKLYKKGFLVMMAVLSVNLIGCAGSSSNSKGKDESGNCSQDFIDSYNRVVSAKIDTRDKMEEFSNRYKSPLATDSSKLAALLLLKSELTKTKLSCDSFLSQYQGVSCRARVSFEEKQISESEHRDFCEKSSDLLQKLNQLESESKNPSKE